MTGRVIAEARASTVLYGLAAAQCRAGIGGRWIVPANVCIAVPLALLSAGADVEFVDIDATSLCLDTGLVTGGAVAGIVYVRSYGSGLTAARDLTRLRRIVGPETLIVDDRCLADPETASESALSQADATLFSTGYGKPLDLGGGGYAFVRADLPYAPPDGPYDPEAYARLEALCRAAASSGGPLQGGDRVRQRAWLAAVPWLPPSGGTDWVTLKRRIEAALPAARTHRQRINDIYAEALREAGALGSDFRAWRFNLTASNSGELVERIFAEGLFASRHYVPATRMFGGASAPVAERLAGRIVNLFNDRHFDVEKAVRVARIVAGWYRPPGTPGDAS